MANPIQINYRSSISIILWVSFVILGGCLYGIIQAIPLLAANPLSWAVWILLGLFIGLIIYVFKIISPVFNLISQWEAYDYRLHEESVVNEIINQDLKLLKLKTEVDEHNMKIIEFNKKHSEKLEYIKWRGIKEIVEQATTPNYYEKVYHKNILGLKNY